MLRKQAGRRATLDPSGYLADHAQVRIWPTRSIARDAVVVGLYAVAMAYVEAAVVVYLQRALSIDPSSLFPVRDPGSMGGLGEIELGREIATLVMLGTVGWLAGRTGPERLACASIAFGIWDIGYYAWLWVFIGWPASFSTYDLLFLIPVPWVAPVWAPGVVSLALIGFGLAVARRLRADGPLRIGARQLALGIGGGIVVIGSFMLDAGNVLAGGSPSTFAWPVFAAGMVLGVVGVATALRSPPAGRGNAAAA